VFAGWRDGTLAKAVPEADLQHPRKLEALALGFLANASKPRRATRALN
jgi:hypothetical protein